MDLVHVASISELPDVPAVYAMLGGRGRSAHVAYVGIASKLKTRISQHLVRRDSSVVTATSAVRLHPDHVTEVRWWEHPDLDERAGLEAAELVAFDVLKPILDSRGATSAEAQRRYEDARFRDRIRRLLEAAPTGVLTIQTLEDALERIAVLETQLAALEQRLEGPQG